MFRLSSELKKKKIKNHTFRTSIHFLFHDVGFPLFEYFYTNFPGTRNIDLVEHMEDYVKGIPIY